MREDLYDLSTRTEYTGSDVVISVLGSGFTLAAELIGG